MALPYELHVDFEKTGDDGVLAGAVTVIVCEDCTCRKLLLWAGQSASGGGDFQPQGPAQTLADWVDWCAGEMYRYPFSVSTEPAGAGARGVRTQVHRIGEWEPDPEQIRLAVPVAQLVPAQRAPVEAQGLAELAPAQRGRRSLIAEASGLVEDVSLAFDREERSFSFGDEIRGAVNFVPARDIVDCRMGLDYQWRTHGQTERRSGEHQPGIYLSAIHLASRAGVPSAVSLLHPRRSPHLPRSQRKARLVCVARANSSGWF